MTRILAALGAHVMSASRPSEALEMLQMFVPDLIVADLVMPGMTGIEMIKEIHRLRAGDDKGPIPAIAFTAHEHFRSAAQNAGFQSFFVKPSDPEQITNEIVRLTGRG